MEQDPLRRNISLRKHRWNHIKQEHGNHYPFNFMSEEEIIKEIKKTIKEPEEIWYDANGDAPQEYTYFYFREVIPEVYLIAIVGNIGIITAYPTTNTSEITKKCGLGKPYEEKVYPRGR